MSDEADEDKQHEPSQRRLDEARRKGQVPTSQDLTTAAVYAALLGAFLIGGSWIFFNLVDAGTLLFAQAGRLQRANQAHLLALVGPAMRQAALAMFALLVPMSIAALGCLLAQRGLVFAPQKLTPKFSRISPLANAGQKFGLDGLVAFAKSVVKMLAVSAVLVWLALRHIQDIEGMIHTDPMVALGRVAQLLGNFLMIVAVLTAVIGLLDFLWQHKRHLQRNRMSHQEAMEEAKDSEGDPHIRNHRRRRAQELALGSMLADVAKADVVIVNPTHYAVALRWNRADRHAPVCVAKGVDEVAARIRERASLAGVPLHRDPPTARALHASVEVGQTIRPEHYRAVAAAIRFSEKIRRKQRPKAP